MMYPGRVPPIGPESTLLETALHFRRPGGSIRINGETAPGLSVYDPKTDTWYLYTNAYILTLRENTLNAMLLPPNVKETK